MLLKLKSRTVLHPIIFTSLLASRGVSECLSDVLLTRSNLFFRNTAAMVNNAIEQYSVNTIHKTLEMTRAVLIMP